MSGGWFLLKLLLPPHVVNNIVVFHRNDLNDKHTFCYIIQHNIEWYHEYKSLFVFLLVLRMNSFDGVRIEEQIKIYSY